MTTQLHPSADALTRELANVAGDTLDAVLFYGSQLHGASPGRESAWDFIVVVRDYRAFYQSMHEAGRLHRPVWLLATIARLLPPSSYAFAARTGARLAKCQIITRADFLAALGPRRRDHLLVARLVQRVEIAWSRDRSMEEWLDAQLRQVRAGVLDWVGPFLDTPFDAESVARRMLELSYANEVRPEPQRAGQLFNQQREHLLPVMTYMLAAAAQAGRIRAAGHGYEFMYSPSAWRRLALRRYFLRSKARSIARWFKHMITFDGWLDYIARKVERRTGTAVELSPLERRLPLIFLWPRVIRVLRAGRQDGQR